MSEPTITQEQANWLQHVATWAVGVLASATGWLFRATSKKFSAHGKRIGELERNAITRDELKGELTEIKTSINTLVAHLLNK